MAHAITASDGVATAPDRLTNSFSRCHVTRGVRVAGIDRRGEVVGHRAELRDEVRGELRGLE